MKKNAQTHFGAGVLLVVFIVTFLIVTGRFVYIQASGEVDDVLLSEWAKQKRTSGYPLDSERGKIYDKNGMKLAYDRLSYRVYAILDKEYSLNAKAPRHVEDVETTAELLAPALGLEESFVLKQLNDGLKADPPKFQVEFGKAGKELTQDQRDDINNLNIPGINFEKEPIRYYPNGMFASHILGFARKEMVKKDDREIEEVTGVTGIENEMNELLGGEDGYISYQRDRYNQKLLDPQEVITKPVNGNDVYLTIDQKIQTLLEDVMSEVVTEYSPEKITATVMDAKTGEVLAMSNRPSYNPNDPSDVKNWYNDAISTPYEPGSTVKMFTWAAAIDAGVYNGDEWLKSGSYRANERLQKVNDHNGGKGWGSITYDEGFARSSNVATAKLVWEKLGTEKYLEYLQAFEFDKKTDIDLPGEVAGQLLYNWPQEKITTGFGQGSTLTPIQQMKAATAITNGGEMLKPYIIKEIIDPETKEVLKEGSRTVVGNPIKEETANEVIELLDAVVNSKKGTGGKYKLDNYSSIGKTGTAQMPDPTGATAYLQGRENNVFSFLGMAPKEDPELIMHVSVSQPKLAAHEIGADPVAHIYTNVMENSLRYLNITPDKESSDQTPIVELPTIINEKTQKIVDALTEEGLQVTVIGSGKKIVKASHVKGDEVFSSDHLILLTDQPTMPDIIGWSLRDVHKLADLTGLELKITGSGYVKKQDLTKNKKIKKGESLNVELEIFKEEKQKEKE